MWKLSRGCDALLTSSTSLALICACLQTKDLMSSVQAAMMKTKPTFSKL